jgi:branched-chain amino acid transport system permease protein
MTVTDVDVQDRPMPPRRTPGALSGPRGAQRWIRPVLWLALLVVGFLLPTLLGGSNRIFSTFVLIAIFSTMAYGLDIVLSYLGEVSLGHTLFWAAGAYATAYFSVKSGVAPLLALVISLLVALALAVLLGLATIRTREFVFSLVTYGAAFIGLTIVANSTVLGGSDGIVGIPVLTLPAVGGQYTASSNADLWPVAFVLLVVVIALVSRFRRSRLGATALMTQMNPDLAITLGVDTRRVRVLVFVLSAPVTAVAGWLYAYQRSYVSPDLLSPYFLLFMLTAVILPGRRLLLGPLVGAAILTVQQELFSFGGNADKIVLGGILATVLLLSPDGLVGIGRMILRRSRGSRGGEGPGGLASPGTDGALVRVGATDAGDRSPSPAPPSTSGERPASRGRGGATQRLATMSQLGALLGGRTRRRGAQ